MTHMHVCKYESMQVYKYTIMQVCMQLNKNARRPKEAHIAQNLKELEILDRT